MASRMDRYNNQDLVIPARSARNKSLYKKIEDLDTYTNIEGVATIEKTNEIDITKVHDLLKNKENEEKIENTEEEETKNYDIKDLLSKAKQTEDTQKNNRKLTEEQINILRSLNNKSSKYDIEQEEKELKELINTISGNKALNELSKTVNDVGLLDELKSDTMVGDASSIKKIIEEEKENKLSDSTELDKSFYTSSFGFTSSDFEELKNINHKIKKSNKYIIILLVILIILIIAGCLFFILK